MSHETPIRLRKGGVWSQKNLRGLRLTVQSGSCWLTEEGDSRDFLLNDFATFEVSTKGRVVVQALTEVILFFASSEYPASSDTFETGKLAS